MPLEFIYRDPENPDRITKRVVFSAYGAGGKPLGRIINAKGVSLGTSRLNKREVEALARRQPNQMTIEMGSFVPYENVYDQVKRECLTRFSAPLRTLGRGGPSKGVAIIGEILPLDRFRSRVREPLPKGLF